MNTRILILALLAFLPGTKAIANSYTTSFPLTENPISESGNWINGKTNGLDWADAGTTAGMAYGTQSGTDPNPYDDSTAILAGTWGPNQTVTASVFTTNQQSGSIIEEVEIRLRSTVTAHTNTGYEITFRCIYGGGYVQIVRWNGALGDYTYVPNGGSDNYNGIKTGDIISASISNNVIIGSVNGVEVIRGTDSTYTTGNPGMGFFLQGATGLNGDYGFTSFTASDGIDLPAPLLSVLVTNGQFSLSFPTVVGQSYAVQQNPNLAATNWVTVTNVPGTGSTYQFSTPATNTESMLFRVREP
jgi:hypothetical protein